MSHLSSIVRKIDTPMLKPANAREFKSEPQRSGMDRLLCGQVLDSVSDPEANPDPLSQISV